MLLTVFTLSFNYQNKIILIHVQHSLTHMTIYKYNIPQNSRTSKPFTDQRYI